MFVFFVGTIQILCWNYVVSFLFVLHFCYSLILDIVTSQHLHYQS